MFKTQIISFMKPKFEQRPYIYIEFLCFIQLHVCSLIMHLLMNFWLDMVILSKTLENDREEASYWQVWHKQLGMFILEEGPTLHLYSFHLDFYLNPELLLHTQWIKPFEHQWPSGKLNFNNGVLNLNQYIYLVHTDE